MKTNTLNTGATNRKSICGITLVTGFLCMSLAVQFLDSGNTQVQENTEASGIYITPLTANDRMSLIKEKTDAARREREIKKYIEQTETSPLAFNEKATRFQVSQEAHFHETH